jgi:hydrogenase-4 component E
VSLAVLALGVAVVAVRRRTLAIALVGAQSIVLGLLALDHAKDDLVPAVLLLAKGVALPALLLLLVRRTREPHLVAPPAGPLVRLAGACAVAFAATALTPPLGLADAELEQAAVATVLVGVTVVVARRPAVLQLVGLIVAENGLSLLAIAAGLSYVIELGLLLDLGLIVAVAAAFTRRIYGEFGTGDTELLRGLRD